MSSNISSVQHRRRSGRRARRPSAEPPPAADRQIPAKKLYGFVSFLRKKWQKLRRNAEKLRRFTTKRRRKSKKPYGFWLKRARFPPKLYKLGPFLQHFCPNPQYLPPRPLFTCHDRQFTILRYALRPIFHSFLLTGHYSPVTIYNSRSYDMHSVRFSPTSTLSCSPATIHLSRFTNHDLTIPRTFSHFHFFAFPISVTLLAVKADRLQSGAKCIPMQNQ